LDFIKKVGDFVSNFFYKIPAYFFLYFYVKLLFVRKKQYCEVSECKV